jgi:hypothetical protein
MTNMVASHSSSAEISIPNNTLVKNIIGLNENEEQSTTTKLPLDGIITLGVGILFTVIYWSGHHYYPWNKSLS